MGSLLIRIGFYIKSMHGVVYCKVKEFYKARVRCLIYKETPTNHERDAKGWSLLEIVLEILRSQINDPTLAFHSYSELIERAPTSSL